MGGMHLSFLVFSRKDVVRTLAGLVRSQHLKARECIVPRVWNSLPEYRYRVR